MSFTAFVVFFFSSRRRHTRCGRDWSSDVCSSDLFNQLLLLTNNVSLSQINRLINQKNQRSNYKRQKPIFVTIRLGKRSEERRVGKECRSGWSTNHQKEKHIGND